MNKMLVAAGAVAIGAGGYLFVQNQAKQDEMNILSQIPADSVAVSVQFEPLGLDYYTATSAQAPTKEELLMMLESDPATHTAREAFFFGLYQAWFDSVKDKALLKQNFGLGEQSLSAFYTVGAVPVFKLELANPAAFMATLDKLEAEHQFAHRAGTAGQISYRAYPLAESENGVEAELVVAAKDNWLTVTFNVTQFAENNGLEVALGAKAPQAPLSATTTMADLQKKYPGVTSSTAGYFDFEQLAKGLTTADGNLLARQLSSVMTIELDTMRHGTCPSEIQGIAANWPRLIWGGKFGTNGSIEAKMVMESNNTAILTALQAMRGFLAGGEALSDAALSFGLGLDVNNLAPSMAQIVSDLGSVRYQCPLLAGTQAEMLQNNPAAMAGMAAGFVNGFKGLSFSLFDYQLQQTEYTEELSKLDGAVILSADNPQMLVQSAAMMIPELSQIQIPADGTPVALPQQLSESVGDTGPFYASMKGNHLAVYVGEKSQKFAAGMLDKPLETNGLVSMTMDYQKLFTPVVDAMQRQGEPVPPQMQGLLDLPYSLDFSYDIDKNGVVLDYTLNVK